MLSRSAHDLGDYGSAAVRAGSVAVREQSAGIQLNYALVPTGQLAGRAGVSRRMEFKTRGVRRAPSSGELPERWGLLRFRSSGVSG